MSATPFARRDELLDVVPHDEVRPDALHEGETRRVVDESLVPRRDVRGPGEFQSCR
jgi:hypothetical protein